MTNLVLRPIEYKEPELPPEPPQIVLSKVALTRGDGSFFWEDPLLHWLPSDKRLRDGYTLKMQTGDIRVEDNRSRREKRRNPDLSEWIEALVFIDRDGNHVFTHPIQRYVKAGDVISEKIALEVVEDAQAA